jgi:transcriptional regulator with XRE-family HTH domain
VFKQMNDRTVRGSTSLESQLDRRSVHNQIFFTNVLRLLDEQGMTKTELANRAEISVSFLSDLTNGKANPSLKVMEAIADALQASLPALLEMTDLDQESLAALSGAPPHSSLPAGYVRVSVILTESQAVTVRQWDEINRKNMHQRRRTSKA